MNKLQEFILIYYSNLLLCFMCIYYLIPIIYIIYSYNSNTSISNIICNPKCKNYIFFFMVLMGFSTILYEFERNDIISTIIISILLCNIYGLLLFNETFIIHYFFAYVVFIIILFFMIRNVYKYFRIVLFTILIFEVCLGIYIIIFIQDNIFYQEVMYIFAFALFYLYLHFISIVKHHNIR